MPQAERAAVKDAAMNDADQLLSDLGTFGDRTSSFLSAYGHFRDHRLTRGRIRYVDVPGAVVAAGEPLCPIADRADAFFAFAAQARTQRKRAVITPIGAALADAVRARGARTMCIGAEPVLELAEWLGELGGPDPLERLPVARALARRGGKVVAWDAHALTDEQRAVIASLTAQWKSARAGPLVGFLNAVDPLQHVEQKALFVIYDGKLEGPAAVLAAVPVWSSSSSSTSSPSTAGGADAWFFADYMRHPDARAGVVELLFVEAARALRARGAREVRLGLCPLGRLELGGKPDGILEAMLRPLLSRQRDRTTYPFSYAQVAAFKEKLGPTRFDPMFIATDGARGPWLAQALAWAHFPDGPLLARTQRVRAQLAARTRTDVLPHLKTAPRSAGDAMRRGAFVFGAAAVFAALHLARQLMPSFEAFFQTSRFIPSSWTPQGVWLGPMFHNHTYHLCGDLASLLFFGLLLEWAAGHALVVVVTAFGLWATNPLSTWLVTPLLQRFRPGDLQRFLTEGDVGSSNAVYAIVGAVAAGLKNPALLLLPFAANGLYLCFAKNSWLSIHHLIGLGGGYAVGWLWRRHKNKAAPSTPSIPMPGSDT
jgi:hypothetical protein